MGRQTARKGTQHGQLRKGTAGKRCKELEFSKLSERQYWMARSGGLISVALSEAAWCVAWSNSMVVPCEAKRSN